MINNISCYIFFLFLIILTACQSDEEKIYQPTDSDSLHFLVENSDLIAVIDIIDGHKRYTNNIDLSQKKFHAIIDDKLFGQTENKIVLDISNIGEESNSSPFKKPMPIIRSGNSLAFLRKIAENRFKPLSQFSVIPIYEGNLSPVWKMRPGMNKFDTFEFGLDGIILDIKEELAKREKM